MKKLARWRRSLAGLLALVATPALADMSVPPARYDIGFDWQTEAEVIVTMIDRFGDKAPYLIRVPKAEVAGHCPGVDTAKLAAEGQELMACYVPQTKTIVYSYDNDLPWLAARLLRHEIGHFLGWPGTHPR